MKQAWIPFASRPVPRYTSYPTAADFAPDVSEPDARLWASATTPDIRGPPMPSKDGLRDTPVRSGSETMAGDFESCHRA